MQLLAGSLFLDELTLMLDLGGIGPGSDILSRLKMAFVLNRSFGIEIDTVG